jgi:tetratricopeptide (TPR) repeat protein
MKLMLSCFWICAFQWIVYSAHSKNPVFLKADSLYSIGNYRLAMVEYERVIYADKNDVIIAIAALQKAYCHKKLGQHAAVNAELQRLQLQNLPDSLLYAIFYEKALAAYLIGDYMNAQNNLIELNYFVKDARLKNQSVFLEIVVLNELQRWEEARRSFTNYLNYKSLDSTLANRLYLGIGPEHLKSSITARRLSYLLPGIGQVYASGLKEGIFSGLLNASMIALAISNFYSGYYFTSVFIAGGLFPAFYLGGATHAEFLVKRDNQTKIRAYNDKLKKVILSIEGIEPK